jgi:hypothetical protein
MKRTINGSKDSQQKNRKREKEGGAYDLASKRDPRSSWEDLYLGSKQGTMGKARDTAEQIISCVLTGKDLCIDRSEKVHPCCSL